MSSLNKPRILFLDQTGKLGGAEFCLADIAQHFRKTSCVGLFEPGPFETLLSERGIRCKVFTLGQSASLIDKKARIGSLLRVVPSVYRTAKQVAHDAKDYDILYANTAKALIVGAISARLSKRPLVYHLHDIIDASHFSSINRRLIVFICNAFASRVICNSTATAEAFVASKGNRALTEVVPNGFEIENSGENSLLPILPEGIPNASPTAIVAGRLTEWKGQHIFIQALASVESLHGLIVGEALFTEEDKAYATYLEQLVEESGLSDRVHFLGFRKDVSALFKAADVVVHSSTSPEPFGRVIVEGMLCRKPVIASKQGGAAEIIQDGETGLLLPPGDADALANALRQLIEDPKLCKNLGDQAYAYAINHFSLEHVMEQIETIMNEVQLTARDGDVKKTTTNKSN